MSDGEQHDHHTNPRCGKCDAIMQGAEDFRTIRLMEQNLMAHLETARRAFLVAAAEFSDISAHMQKLNDRFEELRADIRSELRGRRVGDDRDPGGSQA